MTNVTVRKVTSLLQICDFVTIGGITFDISDPRFSLYTMPEIKALDEGFTDYVNGLKQMQSLYFKGKGERIAIVFLDEELKSLPKVTLENKKPLPDYASVLHQLGFQEKYVQLNDVARRNERILKKAFVYIANMDKMGRD